MGQQLERCGAMVSGVRDACLGWPGCAGPGPGVHGGPGGPGSPLSVRRPQGLPLMRWMKQEVVSRLEVRSREGLGDSVSLWAGGLNSVPRWVFVRGIEINAQGLKQESGVLDLDSFWLQFGEYPGEGLGGSSSGGEGHFHIHLGTTWLGPRSGQCEPGTRDRKSDSETR